VGTIGIVRTRLSSAVLVAALGVCLAILPGSASPFATPKLLVLAIAGLLAALVWVVEPTRIAATMRAARTSPVAWACCLYLLILLTTGLLAADVRQALVGGYGDYRGLIECAFAFLVGIAAVGVWRSGDGMGFVARIAVGVMLGVTAYGMMQRTGLVAADWRGRFRIGSLLGNPSNLGVFCVAVLPFLIWACLRDADARWRIAAAVSSAGALACVVWSLSRGAWVALGLSVVVLVVWVAPRLVGRARRTAAFYAALLLAAIVVSSIAMPGIGARLRSVANTRSKTVAWRVSVWKSSASMLSRRPLVGYGNDNLRYFYPAFQEPGQIGGRNGYQIVESTHNVLVDSAVAAGAPGLLAALAIVVFCIRALWRARADERTFGVSAVLAASAAGIFAAVCVHYLTLDTAPLLAVVLSGVVSIEAREPDTAPSRGLGVVRSVGIGLSALCLASVVAALGLVMADTLIARGLGSSQSPTWDGIAAPLRQAQTLAGWESQTFRSTGIAARATLSAPWGAQGFSEGQDALERVLRMHPLDATAFAQLADLRLAGARELGRPILAAEALAGFRQAKTMDPNTGIAWAGEADCLLEQSTPQAALPIALRAVELSPNYAQAWKVLAQVFLRLGREDDWSRAAKRASGLESLSRQ